MYHVQGLILGVITRYMVKEDIVSVLLRPYNQIWESGHIINTCIVHLVLVNKYSQLVLQEQGSMEHLIPVTRQFRIKDLEL